MAARLTANDRYLRSISETAWQGSVEAIARGAGWRLYHPPDNRPVTARSGRKYVQDVRRGFPDLVLVRAGRLLFVELKTETGPFREGQVEWLEDLAGAGVEVAVWRPRDRALVVAVLVDGHQLPPWRVGVAQPATEPVRSAVTPGDDGSAGLEEGSPR